MPRNGTTKKKIIKLISEGNKTLTDISGALDLAPSTVSQHLHELKGMGAVSEVENQHIKKWKYYKLNQDFDYTEYGIEKPIENKMSQRIFFYAIAVIAAAGILAYFLIASNVNVQSSSLVPVRLTDPPIVPNGTSALYINYSSVSVQTMGGWSSEWVQSNASGSVNLMSLVNVSQLIAGVEIAHNQQVDGVRFNITSASIIINGTPYNVVVPDGEAYANIAKGSKVNASSEILVDLSPIVTAMYSDNSTSFVMLPHAEAILAKRSNNVEAAGPGAIGGKAALNSHEIGGLRNLISNLTITSEVLTAGPNDSVNLSVTLYNKGGSEIFVNNIVVIGNQTPVIRMSQSCSQKYYPPAKQNYSTQNPSGARPCFYMRVGGAGMGTGGMQAGGRVFKVILSNGSAFWQGQGGNASFSENYTEVYRIVAPMPAASNGFSQFPAPPHAGFNRAVGFVVDSNGALEPLWNEFPPMPLAGFSTQPRHGYALAPNESVTLYFNGSLEAEHGLGFSLSSGSEYRVVATGSSMQFALANVTAG